MNPFLNTLGLWTGIIFAAFVMAWMLFGTIVFTIIKWTILIGGGIWFTLWVFGTWMPKKLNRKKQQ